MLCQKINSSAHINHLSCSCYYHIIHLRWGLLFLIPYLDVMRLYQCCFRFSWHTFGTDSLCWSTDFLCCPSHWVSLTAELRGVICVSHKGSSIYDVHKKVRFLFPSACPHASTWADILTLVDVHMRSAWNRPTHRSLEMASTMTFRTYM